MRPVNATLARVRRTAPRRRHGPFARGTRALFAIAPLALLAWGFTPEGQRTLDRGWRTVERALAAGTALPVRAIEVRGARRTDEAELRATLASFYGANILEVDIARAERRLHSLPWVENARIRRLLPDRLQVEIEERTPAALFQGPDGLQLLDAAGHPIPVAHPEAFATLPRLAGHGAPAAWPKLARLLAEVPEIGRRLRGAVRIGDRRWNLLLRGGIEVRLPERRPAEALARLAAMHRRHALLDRAVRSIDLRHDTWLVIRPDLPVEASLGRKRT